MAVMTGRNEKKGYFHQFARSLLFHLGQIPYIIWYPISAVIQFLYSVACRFYSAVKDYYQEVASNQKRLTKLTRKAVRSVLNNRSDLMNTAWMRQICRIFTGLLQFVSLMTTYAGLNFFLGSISPSAAFALAVVIQGTAWCLLNFRGGRKRTGNGKRIFLLSVALFLSTLTSFIGISNVVRSPIQDMKRSYNAYYTAHQEYLDGAVSATNMFTVEDVEDALVQCKEVHNRAEALKTALETLRPDPKSLMAKTTSSTTIRGQGAQANALVQVDSSTSTIPVSNLQQFDATVRSLHTELEDSTALLSYKDVATLPGAEEIFNDATKADGKGAYAKFYLCIKEYAALEKKLNDIETRRDRAQVISAGGNIADVPRVNQATLRPQDFDNSVISNYKKQEKLKQDLEMSNYSTVTKDKDTNGESVFQKLSWLPRPLQETLRVLFPDELQHAEDIRNVLNEEMDNAFDKLPGNVKNDSGHELNKAYRENRIPSSQLYPFRYLFSINNSDWGTSLLALGLAAIIDVFSLLLSMALVKRRDSVLYANDHKESVKNREELLEDCYTYICIRGLYNKTEQEQKSLRKTADIYPYVAKMIESTMRDFIAKFHLAYLPKEIDSFGYLSGEEVKNLDFSQQNLFQTLRLIQLIHPITPSELTSLLENDFYSPFTLPAGGKSGTAENDSSVQSSLPKEYLKQYSAQDIFFLADNRLLMWFNENFSTLLQSAIPNVALSEDKNDSAAENSDPNDEPTDSHQKEEQQIGAAT